MTLVLFCAAASNGPVLSDQIGMTLRGRVQDPSGGPLAGFRVTAVPTSPDESAVVRSGLSGRGGVFVIHDVPPGLYAFQVETPSGRGFVTTDPDDPASNDVEIEVREGVNVNGLVLTALTDAAIAARMAPESGLAGQVRAEVRAAASAVPCAQCNNPATGVGGLTFRRDPSRIVADTTKIRCKNLTDAAGCTRSRYVFGSQNCGLFPRSLDYAQRIDLRGPSWPTFKPDPPPCGLDCKKGTSHCHTLVHECGHADANETKVKNLI